MNDYIHWKDFADASLVQMIRETTLRNRDAFVESTVTTDEADYRKSQVLWHFNYQDLYDRFTAHLKSFMPYFLADFPILPDEPEVELQITVHADGNYFKRHTDNGCEQTNQRLVTFVYYYTLDDKQRFTDGELILETPKGIFTIPPKHNTIVLFPANWWHEVRPVFIPSMAWEDSRMSVNGWFWHNDEATALDTSYCIPATTACTDINA